MSFPGHLALRSYVPGDEKKFGWRPEFVLDAMGNHHDWDRGPPPGYVWSLVRRPYDVLGVVGVLPTPASGHWHAWALLGGMAAREVLEAMDLGRVALTMVERLHKSFLITAQARRDMPAARRTLERMGFDLAGADGDYLLMARIC